MSKRTMTKQRELQTVAAAAGVKRRRCRNYRSSCRSSSAGRGALLAIHALEPSRTRWRNSIVISPRMMAGVPTGNKRISV